MRRLVFAATLFIIACGSHSTAPQPASVALSPRCQAVADSMGAITDLDALPEGAFANSHVRTPTAPATVTPGTRILLRYVARPDGTAEPGTVEIRGTADPAFRAQALRQTNRLRLLPATVDGCPVRSRVDVYLTKM